MRSYGLSQYGMVTVPSMHYYPLMAGSRGRTAAAIGTGALLGSAAYMLSGTAPPKMTVQQPVRVVVDEPVTINTLATSRFLRPVEQEDFYRPFTQSNDVYGTCKDGSVVVTSIDGYPPVYFCAARTNLYSSHKALNFGLMGNFPDQIPVVVKSIYSNDVNDYAKELEFANAVDESPFYAKVYGVRTFMSPTGVKQIGLLSELIPGPTLQDFAESNHLTDPLNDQAQKLIPAITDQLLQMHFDALAQRAWNRDVHNNNVIMSSDEIYTMGSGRTQLVSPLIKVIDSDACEVRMTDEQIVAALEVVLTSYDRGAFGLYLAKERYYEGHKIPVSILRTLKEGIQRLQNILHLPTDLLTVLETKVKSHFVQNVIRQAKSLQT